MESSWLPPSCFSGPGNIDISLFRPVNEKNSKRPAFDDFSAADNTAAAFPKAVAKC